MKKLISWFNAGRSNAPQSEDHPFDPLNAGFLADPGESYARLRDHAPLCELSGGGYLMTRHADIDAAFTNKSLGNSPSRFSVLAARHREKYVAADLAANIPPFLDRPDHVAVRQALSQGFYTTFRAAGGWIPDLAHQSVSGQPRHTTIDLIKDVAEPFVISAMARFVGVPEDPAAIRRASAALFRLFAPISERAEFMITNDELDFARQFLLAAIRDLKDPEQNTLIANLMAWDGPDGKLSEMQIADNAILVLADGIENVKAGIAMAMLQLRDYPDIVADIVSGQTDERQVILECLRRSTPGQIIPRVALEDTEICGHAVAAGTPVFLALGSANLDPEAFDNPEDMNVGREARARFTFGKGRHRCIGEDLAITLMSSMVRELVCADIEVLAQGGDISYLPRFGHRWPHAVPVRLNGAAKPTQPC